MRRCVDGSRLLGRLARLGQFGATDEGITRLAWSAEDRQAVSLVSAWARAAGAEVRIDVVGNLIAEIAGSEPGLAPLVTGSHLDTVVGAGPLDGAYGVVAAVEVLAALRATVPKGTADDSTADDSTAYLRHPLRVVAFVNEEGVVAAPPFTGSRAVAGKATEDELADIGPDGLTLSERLDRAGCDPGHIGEAAWTGPVAATVELHIEQGPVLDRAGTAIGVVSAITAQQRGRITVKGETNHAGTTPMDLRRDALVAAAHAVLAVQHLAVGGPADVATVGRIKASPGVANVVPGACELSFDIRSVDDDKAADAMRRLREALAEIERATGCGIEVSALPPTAGVRTDPTLREVIAEAATSAGYAWAELPSGAGHDCAHLAGLGPVAMIFVPSTGGVSHHAAESTPDAALVAGASVLLDALTRADRILDA